jgi:hypothetical protein
VPSPKDWVAESSLKALAELDALLIDEHGISCYPFSARDAGIQVEYAGMSVHAICAMDALAIPRLVEQEARVTARCKICHRDIACSVAANGSVDGGYSEGLRVIWTPTETAGTGRHILCDNIAFICTYCLKPRQAISFTVPQTAVVGNSFSSFQKPWLARQ